MIFSVYAAEVAETQSPSSQKILTVAQAAREAQAKAMAAAKVKLNLRLQRDRQRIEELALAPDTSQTLAVKSIRLEGNLLISTAELIADMPLVYNASDKPLEKAASEDLYDLRVLCDIIVNPGQPRQVSTRSIQGFTQYILAAYQKRNYAGIYVYVPAEAMINNTALKDQVLLVRVIEAPITDVTIKYYDPNQNEKEQGYLSRSAVEDWSPVEVGQVANQKKLDDFVNLLNVNPDRYVSAVVTKGAEPNSLAVTYDIYEANPWHFFVQVDNAGTKDRRWTPRMGFINTNLLGIDDTFTTIYQAPWDKRVDEEYSIYGSYDFPLAGPGLRLNVYGGYSQFDVAAQGPIGFIGNGSFVGGILRYNLLQSNGWFLDATGSVSYERSKVTPSIFPQYLASNLWYTLLGWGVDLHKSDDMSNSSLTFQRVHSVDSSPQSEFTKSRTGGADEYFSIYTTTAAHSQFLDPNKVQRLSASLRWIETDERLAPAKMTTFGGLYSIRGYHEDEIVADAGIIGSVQYEFDIVKYQESLNATPDQPQQNVQNKGLWLKRLAPLAFFDYGRAYTRDALSTEDSDQTLYSVGAGAIVELGDNFSGGVYYGYPLKGTNATDIGEGRWNVSLMMRW